MDVEVCAEVTAETTEAGALREKRTRLPHLRELDGLRGVGAIAVFFHHLCFANFPLGYRPEWSGLVRWLFHLSGYGAMGVDLFFVLSGFLITSILLEERNSTRYYKDFYWKRALRILPLYIVCLLGLLVVTRQVGYVLMAAFFVANFASVVHVLGIGPFWTLSIEEQFYVLWPGVVRRSSTATLKRWAVGVALGCVAARVAFALFGKHNYELSFLHCDGLAYGAVLACQYREKAFEGIRGKRHDAVMGISAALGLLLLFGLDWTWTLQATIPFALLQTGVTLVAGAVIGTAIAHAGSPALWPLRSRLLQFFGLISYAFYMIHLYALGVYDHYAGEMRVGDERAYWIRFFAVLAITVALSVVSRYAIELPAMRLRKYVLKHPKPPTADDAVGAPIPLGRMD